MSDGIEKLKDDVVRRAKSQAITIIGEGKAEGLRIVKEAEKRAEDYRIKSEEEAKKAVEQIKKRELMSAELEAKKIELEAKKGLTEEVFKSVKEKISGLKDSERAELISALCHKASREIDVATVYCNKKDSKFVKGADVMVQDMLGGIIAESNDQRIRIDYSFETILEQAKDNSFKDINEILF